MLGITSGSLAICQEDVGESNEKPEKNFVYVQSRVPTPGTYIW